MKTKSGGLLKVKTKNVTDKSAGLKKELASVSTNEFFEQDFEDDADGEESNVSLEEAGNESSDSEMDPVEYKKSLDKLKDTDPEFYQFLAKNDTNLLDIDMSSEDEGDDADDEATHIPSSKLEVASDESDFEPDEGTTAQPFNAPVKVTQKLLKTWHTQLQTDKTAATIRCVTEALHAALLSITSDPDGTDTLPYKVKGGAIFNGIVQLCVMELPNALKNFLKLPDDTRMEPHKAKRFVKIKNVLKSYMKDTIKILENLTSADILTVLLKHVHQMLPYFQSFSTMHKRLLKILIKFWSAAEEEVRVVSFLSILRLATTQKDMQLDALFKTMYVKYVENTKFVSPNTLPGINFMRHSLAEVYLLNPHLSYKHAFLYIRQLAIHLRNATTLKKRENFQTLYNWQFVNSLQLWTELISMSKSQSSLRDLMYPLVQIIIGTMKLIPTAQYYPLRFHCVSMLIQLSKGTGTFIPILPYLLEILNSYDFNKKHKTVSMKPMSLMCVLRASKSQMQENGFNDALIETIYEKILEIAAKDSNSIAFSDMYVSCIIQLKAFLKGCRLANYCRKIKQLLDKIQENAEFIDKARDKIVIDLNNMAHVQNWENVRKTEGTPLSKFYESWVKVHESQKLKALTQNDQIGDYNIPTVRRSNKKKRDQEESSDDSDLDMPVELIDKKLKKKELPKKKQKVTKVQTIDDDDDASPASKDVVRVMQISDWDD